MRHLLKKFCLVPPEVKMVFASGTTYLSLSLLIFFFLLNSATAQPQRSHAIGNFMLDLDGKTSLLQSVEGGNTYADVIETDQNATPFTLKHIGSPKYEDITIDLNPASPSPIHNWIQASWDMNYQRKSGAIVAADFKMEAMNTREFFDALLTEVTIPTLSTEVTIPALDGASKEHLKVKITPEYIRFKKAGGKIQGDVSGSTQKKWLPANFKIEIDGLDCSKVSKIESFTIKQTVVKHEPEEQRDRQLEPTKLEFPNVSFSLPEESAQSFLDYFEDFVIAGNNDDAKQKNGSLIFLDPTRQKELLRINFIGMGIFKLSPDKSEANDDKIKRIKAEFYVERMEYMPMLPPLKY